jgi:small subunit ribosomal protein S8
MSHDSIGDFLTIIRNGVRMAKPFVVAPHSVMRQQIAQLLKDKGFIRDVVVLEEEAPLKEVKLLLKYVDGESVIHEITRISTPGRRTYAGSDGVKPVIGGLGVTILSTSRGVITHDQAKALNVGGEVIATVW